MYPLRTVVDPVYQISNSLLQACPRTKPAAPPTPRVQVGISVANGPSFGWPCKATNWGILLEFGVWEDMPGLLSHAASEDPSLRIRSPYFTKSHCILDPYIETYSLYFGGIGPSGNRRCGCYVVPLWSCC